MKNTICYKCHGQGHMARDCKTNMFISLEEHYALINQKLAEKEQSSLVMIVTTWKDEILDSDTNKKERHDQILNIRRATNLQEGDYVRLSLNSQKLHIDHRNDEPMDEGPFRIQKKIGYETFKVLLRNGVCATLTSNDLVPCLHDET
ncbi:Branchpoint-bridging protein [Bienertia sinuspersici]